MEAAKNAAAMRVTLLDLSRENLAQIACTLNYQAASRLLACCQLFNGLLTSHQLAVLRSRDPAYISRAEKEKLEALKIRDTDCQWQVYRGPLPCYRCLEWLVSAFLQNVLFLSSDRQPQIQNTTFF